MLASALPSASVNAVNAAAPPAAAPPTSSGEPGPFARELERAAQEEAPKAPPAATRPNAPERARAHTTPDTKKPADAHAARPTKADVGELTSAAEGETKDATADGKEAAPTDPGSLLAGLLAPPRAPATSAPDTHASSAKATLEAARIGASATRETAGAALRGAAEERNTGRADAGDMSAAPSMPGANVIAALAQAPAPQTTPVAATATDVRAAHVPAPLGSPEFAPAIGAQVSLLVREGVQEARLQLNPPEMGPVTVQIQIEGSNAQVSLAAEHAPTRDALEQALPALAGALRENGLTLTGGGVFEQPRQPRDAETPSPAPASAAANDDGAAAPSSSILRGTRFSAPRGVVDLYA